MSYVIVKFDVPSLAPASLYVVNGEAAGANARPSDYRYVLDSFNAAVRMAAGAARQFERLAAYAVFCVDHMGLVDDGQLSGLVPALVDPTSPFCAVSPCYVPALHSVELFARYGSVWAGLPEIYGTVHPSVVSLPDPDPVDFAELEAALASLVPDYEVVAPAAPSVAAVAPAAVVRFEVRAGLNGTDRDQWSSVMDFDNGKDAGAWVASNRASFAEAGKSLVIVRVEAAAPVVNWREREALRLTDGTYTPLPGGWAERIALYYPDHYAHVSSNDKRKVAFTESESSGERDKQKVLSASEYVRRFFNGEFAAPYWGDDRRGRFIADMLGDSIPVQFVPLGDADALEAIYCATRDKAAHGCMSYPADHYQGPIHPVRVYAMGGDITLAYLQDDANEDEDDYEAGEVIARCLVWPEKQQYGRVYGAVEHQRMLRTALEAQGYSSGCLTGAKIAKVEHGGNAYVMPYLDIGGGEISDCGTYFEVGGDITASRTDGLVYLRDMMICESCDESVPEDEVFTVETGAGSSECWCQSCRESGATWSDCDEAYIVDHETVQYRASWQRYAEAASTWFVEREGATYVESEDAYCEDAGVCTDCSEGFLCDDLKEWQGGDTGQRYQDAGDMVCQSCHDDREESARALRLETEPELELKAPTAVAVAA